MGKAGLTERLGCLEEGSVETWGEQCVLDSAITTGPWGTNCRGKMLLKGSKAKLKDLRPYP